MREGKGRGGGGGGGGVGWGLNRWLRVAEELSPLISISIGG